MLSTLYCTLLYCGNTSPGKIFTKTHIIVVNFHWICFSKLIVARSPTSQIWNKHISVSSLLIFGYVFLRGLSSACWCLAFLHSLGHFNVFFFYMENKIAFVSLLPLHFLKSQSSKSKAFSACVGTHAMNDTKSAGPKKLFRVSIQAMECRQ